MKKGFTLIELLAVVLIMGILASVAMPKYTRSLDRARMVEAEQMLAPIYEARERVRLKTRQTETMKPLRRICWISVLKISHP